MSKANLHVVQLRLDLLRVQLAQLFAQLILQHKRLLDKRVWSVAFMYMCQIKVHVYVFTQQYVFA